MKLNKKAVSISILILVLSSLALSAISLAYFAIKNRDITKIFGVSNGIDQVYIEKSQLDFYLQDIFDKSINNFNIASSTSEDIETAKNVFIDNFKKELNIHKDSNDKYPIESLVQVEKKVNTENFKENIELTNEKIVLRLSLNVKKSYVSGDETGVFYYNYEKKFEKVFKG